MSSLARTTNTGATRRVWLSRIPGPLLLGALAHVIHNQSTQEGQHESIGTIYLSLTTYSTLFPYSFPL
jgi:hypothetical protein